MILTNAHYLTWALIPFCLLLFYLSSFSAKPLHRVVCSFLLLAVCSGIFYSAPAFAVWFVFPAFVAGCLFYFLSGLRNLFFPIFAIFAGIFCSRFFEIIILKKAQNVTVQYKGFAKNWTDMMESVSNLAAWFFDAAQRHPFIAVAWVAFFVVLIKMLASEIFGRKRKSLAEGNKVLFVRLFFLFSPVCSVATCFLTGNYHFHSHSENPFEMRYFIPAVFSPLFIGWAFTVDIESAFSRLRLKIPFSAFFVFFSFFLIAVGVPGALKLKKNAASFSYYYPQTVKCFDDAASKFGLKKGLSTYWWAKSTMAVSKTDGIGIGNVTVFPDRNGRKVIYKFFWNINGRFLEGPFDFIITNSRQFPSNQNLCLGEFKSACDLRIGTTRNIDDPTSYILRPEDVVYSVGGTPSATVYCDEIEILVFNPPI